MMKQSVTLLLSVRALARGCQRLVVTRGQLAERAGLSRATVSRAFAGRPVGVRAARRIAGALGVPVTAIVGGQNLLGMAMRRKGEPKILGGPERRCKTRA
jgi:transcriptional regulator with XRE-family HTH domain